jgi:uncharacterized protein YjbJ (UPF0337 family)
MADQEFGAKIPRTGEAREGQKPQTSMAGGDRSATVTGTARDASGKLKETVSETANAATDRFKDLLDKQMGNHISAAGILAGAMKQASGEIEEKSPLAAGLVRRLSDSVEQFAETYEDETVEQLVRSVTDLTRRQPALVFGLAAVAGFLVFRTVKTASATTQSPSIQPMKAHAYE